MEQPKTMVILMGLPGSGKSTWGKQVYPHFELINGDELATESKVTAECERIMILQKSLLVDATNLTLNRRDPLLALGKKYGYIIYGMYFNIPVKTCLERIKRRVENGGNKVSRVAVYTLNKKAVIPVESEGFTELLFIIPDRVF
jgi:predicted kinase